MYICTMNIRGGGKGDLRISFVGMSIPRKVFLLYNFRKWTIINKEKEKEKKV